MSIAYAATTAATPAQGGVMGMLPMLVIFMFFMYFFIIRPQNKRAKAHRELMQGLKKGDEVVTNGGLMGEIEQLQDDTIRLSVAKDVVITMQRHCIVSVLPKGSLKAI